MDAVSVSIATWIRPFTKMSGGPHVTRLIQFIIPDGVMGMSSLETVCAIARDRWRHGC